MAVSLLGGWGFIKLVKKYMGSDLPEHVKQIYNMPEGPEKEQALSNLALSSRQDRVNKFSNDPSMKEKIKRVIESTTSKVLDKINFYEFMTNYELRYGDTLIMRQNCETISQFLIVDCFMQQEVARITDNFIKSGISNIKSISTNEYNWYFNNDNARTITKAQFINQQKQISDEESKIKEYIIKYKNLKKEYEKKMEQQTSTLVPDFESMKKFNKLSTKREKAIKILKSYDNQLIGLGEYQQLLETSKQYTQQN